MNENIEAFLKVLDPADNSTGGGTASAISGAMAASLVAMVARLSIGKKRMESESFYTKIAREAEDLSTALFSGGYEDSKAYESVSAAYRLPKETDREKAVRTKATQQAMIQAARVPLANGEHCRRVMELCLFLEGRSNPNAASDLECAGHLAKAGMLGCLANVEINLPHIRDTVLREDLADRAGKLREFAAMTD